MKNAVKTICILSLATALSILISYLGVGNESIIMVFLLSVLFTAVFTSNRGWAIGAALFCALLFNFLFTDPLYSFFIYGTNDIMLLLFFLVTGIVSGTVTSRLQTEMKLASQNEQTAKTLYRIACGFLSASGKESVVKKAEDLVYRYAGLTGTILLDQKDLEGFAISSGSGQLGTLVIHETELNEQQLLIVQAVCTQLGIALERETLVADREKIRLAMEREQQRSTFLRSVAHDLRSPLTALSGAGHLLADNYDVFTDAERKKLASDICEEIVWLTNLVENILNMTRISEHRIVLYKQEEVIDDIIAEAVKHTERLLRERNFHVQLPAEIITAPMDGKLIVQVLINLLENAVRHTPQGSSISLTAAAEKDKLMISVSDNGNGIPPAIKDHLFERFVTQEKKIVDGRRGLGLGLSICKAIVEAHGGEIHVTDTKPTGAEFVFTLPMEETNE